MSMTSRERVLTTINHGQPDRVPLVIGVSNATGIKMEPYRGIKRLAGIQAPDKYLYDWPELGTAEIDEKTMLRLHSDVRGVLETRHGQGTWRGTGPSQRLLRRLRSELTLEKVKGRMPGAATTLDLLFHQGATKDAEPVADRLCHLPSLPARSPPA